jgi:hypothetical protein
MDDDALASLISEADSTAAPEGEAPAAAPAPQGSEGPARGADGRFAPRAQDGGAPAQPAPAAPAAPPAAATAAPAPAAPPAAPPEPGHIPITALLEEREKRQAAERRAQELQARVAPPAPPTEAQRIEAALRQQAFDISRRFAEQAHTPEVVAQAHEWAVAKCDADPAFNARMHQSRDPYGDAIKAWRQEQLLQAVSPDDLDDYKAWKASRAAQAAGGAPAPAGQPAPAQQPALSPPPPPRSLANAPNAGGGAQAEIAVGPGAAFASTIGNHRR